MSTPSSSKPPALPRPLRGVRILSLALNLPGPAALMRLRAWGARCSKLEAPAGDPMAHYNPAAYEQMHAGVKVFTADLRSDKGQAALHRALAATDVLLTSFRPSALRKLGLDWKLLHKRYPALCQVAIVGGHGEQAEEPGHDLTYMAENDLVDGLDLPPTLYADMGGSLAASEAVLAAVLQQRGTGRGVCIEVALAAAAQYLALPRAWGLTARGAAIGGGHAGYRVYPCKDGRVAVAALEPHFAEALCEAAGVDTDTGGGLQAMFRPATHAAIAAFLARRTRTQLHTLARQRDIPLHTLPR